MNWYFEIFHNQWDRSCRYQFYLKYFLVSNLYVLYSYEINYLITFSVFVPISIAFERQCCIYIMLKTSNIDFKNILGRVQANWLSWRCISWIDHTNTIQESRKLLAVISIFQSNLQIILLLYWDYYNLPFLIFPPLLLHFYFSSYIFQNIQFQMNLMIFFLLFHIDYQ